MTWKNVLCTEALFPPSPSYTLVPRGTLLRSWGTFLCLCISCASSGYVLSELSTLWFFGVQVMSADVPWNPVLTFGKHQEFKQINWSPSRYLNFNLWSVISHHNSWVILVLVRAQTSPSSQLSFGGSTHGLSSLRGGESGPLIAPHPLFL